MTLSGYIANTDHDWYRFLAHQRCAEVNFWQPSGSRAFRAIEPGEPVLFKLKKAALRDRRLGPLCAPRDPARLARLGCVRCGQRCADLRGDVRAYCKVSRQRDRELAVASGGEAASSPRYGEPTLVSPRLGQGAYRVAVLDACGRACSVTNEHSLPVLDAAHIRPFAAGGEHDVANGVVLRSDVHRLFDRGYVTITEQGHLEVSARLRDDFDNGRTYYPLHGKPLTLPQRRDLRPSAAAIRWHNANVWMG